MIGSIEGNVILKEERSLLISVGGVGYVVFVTPGFLVDIKIGDTVMLFTHMAVRDDALDLYGFAQQNDLAIFRLLIGISGIGPKSAQNVLSLADTATLLRAVGTGDSAYLTKVAGIGKKLAEKIVHELKDKVDTLGASDSPASKETEALEALEVLGYSMRETREMVRVLANTHATTELIIHKALQQLGGRS